MKIKIFFLIFVIAQSLFFSKVVYAGNTEISDIVYDNVQDSVDDFVENTKSDILELYTLKFENIKENVISSKLVDFDQIKLDIKNFITDKSSQLISRFISKNE